MITIIKKVRLVAADEAPFIGTKITIAAPDQNLLWGIKAGSLSPDSTAVTINWGDGQITVLGSDIQDTVHTYPKGGVYEVRISDDITTLQPSGPEGNVFCDNYAPMISAVYSNAQKLAAINPQAFRNALNLKRLEMSDCGVTLIRPLAFSNCLALESLAGLPRVLATIFSSAFYNSVNIAGRIDLPAVNSVSGAVTSNNRNLFAGCAGITEIHFAAASEENIKTSSAYRNDPQFGAPNAAVLFDL